jgi:hypothetical protein
MMASSVFAGLKQQGYHVTLYAASPSSCIVKNDPNIDVIIEHDMSMPQEELCGYWLVEAAKYDKWVNLSASVECEYLQLPGQTTYQYPLEVRKALYNKNYLEHQHLIAGVPHVPQIKFWPTQEEVDWANTERLKYKDKILVWVLAGSSVHKMNPHINNFCANVLKLNNVSIILVGTPEQNILAEGLRGVENVHLCTHWDVRSCYTFVQQHADVIIGPETGIMSGMCQESMKKVVLLSHSTTENLTRDWVNTSSIFADPERLSCGNCCLHRLSDGDDVAKFENTGYALCQVHINPQDIWNAALPAMCNK